MLTKKTDVGIANPWVSTLCRFKKPRKGFLIHQPTGPMPETRSQEELDNYSRQLNPEDDTYWRSRGYEGRDDQTPIGTGSEDEEQ